MPEKKKQMRGLSTRDKIVEAALSVMSERGLSQTSIKEIAAAAEINPGLIHYHFKNKEAVLAAVVRKISRDIGDQWAEIRRTGSSGPGFMERAFDLLEARIVRESSVYRARFELYVAAMNSPALQPELRALIAEVTSGMQESLKIAGVSDEQERSRIANILYGCFDSFAMRSVIDHDFDLKGSMDVLKRVVRTAV